MIEWLLTLSEDVVSVACPALRLFVPSAVVPSLKVTVPVGVPEPGGVAVTVAVKVTDWLTTEGLADELTVVVVEDGVMFAVVVAVVLNE